MEIKSGKIFIPIFIGILILSFVTTLYFTSSTVDEINSKLYAENETNSKQQVRKNVEILHRLFRTVQPTINSVTSQIHKNIIKKHSLQNQRISTSPLQINTVNIFENYTYNYLIYSLNNSTNKFECEFSSINSNFFFEKINTYSLNILQDDKSKNQKLWQNQIINKLTKFNNNLYIMSIKSIQDRNGHNIGATVVLMNLSDFIRLSDFIYAKDSQIQVDIFDASQKYHLYNSNNVFSLESNIYNIDTAIANTNRILTIKNINKTNLTTYYSINYYDYLDVIIASKIELNNVDKNINKTNLTTIFSISLIYFIIFIVVLFVLTYFISKYNDITNKYFSLLKNIVNFNNSNGLSLINSIKKKPFKYIWSNFYKTKEVIKNIEEYLLENSNNNKENNIDRLNNVNYYIDKIIKSLEELEKNQSLSIISKFSNSISIIKRNNLLFSQNYNKIQEYVKNYNEIGVSLNIIALNLTILCYQINDSRLNELLLLVQKTNRKLQNANDGFEVILSNKEMEIVPTNSEFIKIENNMELINSIEKKKINTLNSMKKTLKNIQNNLTNQGDKQ